MADVLEVEDNSYLYKGPCDACGSSDANGHYSDGHTYCFSCHTRVGNATTPRPSPRKSGGDTLRPVDLGAAWRSRGLTLDTVRKWGLGTTRYNGKHARVFPYYNKEGLVAQKIRPAAKDDIRWLGDKDVWLFGQQLWRSKGKMVVITEGEIDAASISQLQSHKWPVVSVVNGAQSAAKSISKNMDWLSGFDTVVLCFDNDEYGEAAAKACAPLFRPGTCKIAHLPLKDANEMLQAGRGAEVIDAIWGAQTYRPDGIVLGEDLWDSLTSTDDTFALSYPWAGLQASTLGCRLGELVTITAGSGIGKSAVVRSLAHHLLVSHSEKVGMLMFEETVKRTALGLMSIEMKKPLTLLTNPSLEEGFENAFRNTVGSGRLALYDHFGSTALDNVLDRIRYMARAMDCRWIFVDHLSILISGEAEGDERRLIDNAMTALKTLAMELNIGLFLVSHLKRPPIGKGHEDGATTHLGQLRGSHAIAQLSDIVIGLERNQQDPKLKNITTIRVLKNRFTGDTGKCGWLEYTPDTGTLQELIDDPESNGPEGAHNPF